MDALLPMVIEGLLALLERGVVPLMRISLGLSLALGPFAMAEPDRRHPGAGGAPAACAAAGGVVYHGPGSARRAAVVVEAAMPSMVLGIVFCDRFNLDVSLYAVAVTISTLLSLFTLPMWFQWLSG